MDGVRLRAATRLGAHGYRPGTHPDARRAYGQCRHQLYVGAAAPQHAFRSEGQAGGCSLAVMKIGIIGAGGIGQASAGHVARAGYEVIVSNSRGADSLAKLVSELGP